MKWKSLLFAAVFALGFTTVQPVQASIWPSVIDVIGDLFGGGGGSSKQIINMACSIGTTPGTQHVCAAGHTSCTPTGCLPIVGG